MERGKKRHLEVGVGDNSPVTLELSREYVAGLDENKLDAGKSYSKITPDSGLNLKSLSSLLKDPQSWTNHKKLMQYCAYYGHYDNMLSGAFLNIFIPFSQVDYKLIGGDEEVRKDIANWLEDISFRDLLEGMAYDYYIYGRFVAYLYESGVLQLLPVFRCSIENLAVNGNPIMSFELDRTKTRGMVDISDYERKYAGYPEEIVRAAKNGQQYALLNVDNAFSCSMAKSAWEKYSVPMMVSAFPYVIKKDMLAKTEEVELSNMSKSLLEVQVGDRDKVPCPSELELKKAGQSYVSALKNGGASIAVVSWNVKGNWLIYNNKEVLDNIVSSTSFQNWNILAALSISPVLSAGSEHFNKGASGSFSQTSAAVSTINKRINGFLDKVTLVMNRVINKYAENNDLEKEKLPRMLFDKVDLSDDEKLMNELLKLYDRGLVSNKTLFENTELDYLTERENRVSENKANDLITFKPRPTANQMSSDDFQNGRPTLDDSQRKSDKENSLRSNYSPKPSTE